MRRGMNLMTNFPGMRNLLVVMFLFTLMACANINEASRKGSGVYHLVRKGETLYRIARAYDIDINRLARANNIEGMEALEADRALFIPDARHVIDDVLSVTEAAAAKKNLPKPSPPLSPAAEKSKPAGHDKHSPPETPAVKREALTTPDPGRLPLAAPADKVEKTLFPSQLPPAPPPEIEKKAGPAPIAEAGESRREGKIFIWPVAGKVVARFGRQSNGMFKNGVKIVAAENAPVVAAAGGTVIYSAPLKDYGETLIIKHKDDYATIYAHLGRRLVKFDARLKQGEKIAILSRKEAKGEPFLHFEVRRKNKAYDPLLFLP